MHLDKLRCLWRSTDEQWRHALLAAWRPKMSIARWAQHAFGDNRPDWIEQLPDEKPNRFELPPLIEQLEAPSRIVAIFAWGGMGIRNGRSAVRHLECFSSVVREPPVTRKEWYQRLKDVGARGVGPAFYTKLIRFLGDDEADVGFIMDQWLARSVNLIEGSFIRMHGCGKKYVHRENDSEVYERFCSTIAHIANEVGATAVQIEEFMFASPEWRDHVRQSRAC